MSNTPSRPLGRFGQVVPTAATRMGKFGDHTSLTEEHLSRRAKEVSNRFDDNPAFLELRKNLAELEQDLNDMFHARHLSPGAHLENAVVEQFLHTFCNKVFLPQAYGPHSIITTDDILSSPPRHDVLANCLFWKMVAKFCVYRQKELFVNPEQKRYLSTARVSWQHIKTIYYRLTHKRIDYNIALEVSALITEESIHKANPKPVARYRDLVTFITDGVFGNHLLLCCPCQQLQLAAHHLIVFYCAVRPSEVTLTWLATNALKYCDLEFYLTLWEDDDDSEQDDDDNELMEDDGGMLVVRDSGHEVQPSQCRRTQYRLGCEVTFRNLKGGQTNPNIYRTQPLYDSGGPACMEPTIILAQLAEEDSVFDHGISIASVMETADPEYFKNVDEFLPIPIKTEAKDCFVLCAIELALSSGRGTTSVAMAQHQSATSTSTLLAADNNSPTSGSNWLTLDCTSVTEGAKRLAVGHLIASSQIVKSYLSRHNVVDIQGLVQRGKESKNCIMLHGLHRVKTITDTPNSLHAVEIAGVESMPIIQRIVCKYNQAKVALSDASAQGLPVHEYQALKVDHNKKMKCLERTQCQLQRRTMIEHAYKEKEDLNVCALHGSLFGGAGPAAAAQELSQQLQAGGDTNDNDSSDQAGSSTMHQASTSSVPLGSHLDSHTSNQGNANPSYEWMHQAASIPFLSQAPLSFASTSTPSSSTADDLADISLSASGTSLSAKESLSLHLCEKLDGLCNQIGSMIGDLPQPEYDLLKKDGASVPLCELFTAMTTNNVGTQNAVLATLEKQNVHIYPDCSPVHHCPFCNMQIPTYDFTDHLREHDLVLGAKALLRRPNLVSQPLTVRKCRDNWISWVQSITSSPPPPAAMLSIQSAAQEEINASMAQVVTDAKEQVAGQVGRSVLPISSTGATQEASSANSSRPMLSAGHHGHCSRPLVVHHACPFCAQDKSLPGEQRSRVWEMD
ncbi:hypothetical protein NDA13_005479 [Ustilago tritici]|nr:hypothetical protein NDA13_005479 [Ustilago tritici]